MSDNYIYFIVPLLPLTAWMVVFQGNPYQAIVLRGILGAISALVYTVLGAPDVALTEALVGTLLAVTLYAIATRSSLVFRLGILQEGESEDDFGKLLADLRAVTDKYHLRLELVPHDDAGTLEQALIDREIHATCTRSNDATHPYHTAIRVRDFYDIVERELVSPVTSVTYTGEKKA